MTRKLLIKLLLKLLLEAPPFELAAPYKAFGLR